MTKEPLRIDLEVGKKVPIYCSSLGKAILAYNNRRDFTSINFEKFTEKTITESEALIKELEDIKLNGYAFDDEEYIEYLSCIAVPIKSKDGSAIASISIATPTIRLDDERKEQFIKYLKYYASCIEGELARSYIL